MLKISIKFNATKRRKISTINENNSFNAIHTVIVKHVREISPSRPAADVMQCNFFKWLNYLIDDREEK